MAYRKTDSLASLIDELGESWSDDIQQAINLSSQTAVAGSIVDTGRFVSSWRVGIDEFTAIENEDARGTDGSYSLNAVRDESAKFNILENKSITLYNNVLDPNKNFNYAQTVGYDFTGNNAFVLLSNTEQTAYSYLRG